MAPSKLDLLISVGCRGLLNVDRCCCSLGGSITRPPPPGRQRSSTCLERNFQSKLVFWPGLSRVTNLGGANGCLVHWMLAAQVDRLVTSFELATGYSLFGLSGRKKELPRKEATKAPTVNLPTGLTGCPTSCQGENRNTKD